MPTVYKRECPNCGRMSVLHGKCRECNYEVLIDPPYDSEEESDDAAESSESDDHRTPLESDGPDIGGSD